MEYRVYVDMLNKLDIMIGSDGKFYPNKRITRAEVAKLLENLDNNYYNFACLTKKMGYVADILYDVEQQNDEDVRHPGQKVGLGVAVCQNPKDMEEDCEVIEYGNEKYKIGFMLRINPDAIRIPKSENGKYWVVSGTRDDLRPYGILYKKIK